MADSLTPASAVARWLRPFVSLVGVATLWASNSTDDFSAANRLYEQGRYAEAAAAYERVLAEGHTSPALHFNLGNARFRSGQIGLAIVQFQLAQILAPRDPDIRANLQFARQSVTGTASQRRPVWEEQLRRLTLDEWSLCAMAPAWILFALLTLAASRPDLRRRLRWLMIVCVVSAIALGLGAALAWRSYRAQPIAVVVQHESPVRYGPLEESQVHFEVPDGTELGVTDAQGDWIQVLDSGKRPGWIHHTNVIVIPMAAVPKPGSPHRGG